jgi:2-iminobutanoate/2-iminopropanoate deaminase
MSARYINPAGLKTQSYYTHGIVREGTPVFLTGQVAWDEYGELVGAGDIEAQMAQIWKNIETAVTALGAKLEHIVKIVTYSTSREWLPAIHAERSRHFEAGRFPASTFVLVGGLVDPEMYVEIDVTVVVPHGGGV